VEPFMSVGSHIFNKVAIAIEGSQHRVDHSVVLCSLPLIRSGQIL